MSRKRITLGGSVQDLILIMGEGIPGALRVLLDIITDDSESGLMTILGLDDMNIRGSQIWIGYKDFCGEDLEVFKLAIKDRSREMVDLINSRAADTNAPEERAVTGGASFER